MKIDGRHYFRNLTACAVLGCLLLVSSWNAVESKFAQSQTKQVPIARLIRNLEAQRGEAMNKTDKAMIEFRIGRLHAMAYALKTEEAACNASAIPNSRFELPDFGHTPDHVQFQVDKSSTKEKQLRASKHLTPAIQSLEAALKYDPDLLCARLGLAWCLEQSGDKARALSLYRQVFNKAFEEEKNAKGGMYNWSITVETASYLKALLNPAKDKKELELVESKVKEIEKLPRYVTPIAIPLAGQLDPEKLLLKSRVIFDLDGFGKRIYKSWISPEAAWLVFAQDRRSKIESGLQMVGQSSFWIFWQNGYEVLRALDDNADGLLSGEELDGISCWQDRNLDGISADDELFSLSDLGIVALEVKVEKHSSGILWSSCGVHLKDGTSKPSFDLILDSD